jgi:hypothetical protein
VTFLDETSQAFTIVRTWNPAEDHPYRGEVQNPAESFPALFLSQNEIIKIAESEAEQMAFIDRFFDFRSYQQEVAALDHRLEDLDSTLGESFRAFQTQIGIEQAIAAAAKEIETLDQALKNPTFDQFTKSETKDRALREQKTFVESLSKQWGATRKEYTRIQPPPTPETCLDDPAVRRTLDVVAQAQKALLERFDDADAKLAAFRQQIEEEYSKWSPQFQAAKTSYGDAVLKEGGDYRNLAQKRARRVKDIEGLQQKLAVLKQKSDQIREINTQRDEAIDALKKAYERYSKQRQARCQEIEAESAGRLKVRIHESSNVDEFRTRLTSLKKGSYLRDAEIDSICTKSDPGSFVKAVVRHHIFGKSKSLEELAGSIGIEKDRMVTLAEFLGNEFPVEQLLALEHKALPQDRPEILYNVGEGKFEMLNRLSVGQKCTAMLIIALSEGSFPIVIDQPEDSLDIRTIWDDMCTKIRRGKERRQFIFTTHNSSLAVASDTDKFTILEAGAAHGRVMYSGSMDHSPLSEEVMTYLEGGIETYKTKYGKYRVNRDEFLN